MSALNIFFLLSLFATVFGSINGVIDLMTGERLLSSWLSFGTATLGTESWTTLQSQFGFIASAPDSTVVLMSLPDLGGDLPTQGNATSVRLRNIVYDANSKSVSFEARVSHISNDKPCSFNYVLCFFRFLFLHMMILYARMTGKPTSQSLGCL